MPPAIVALASLSTLAPGICVPTTGAAGSQSREGGEACGWEVAGEGAPFFSQAHPPQRCPQDSGGLCNGSEEAQVGCRAGGLI